MAPTPSNTRILMASVAAVAGLAALYFCISSRRRRRRRNRNINTKIASNLPKLSDAQVHSLFQQAVETSRTSELTNVTHGDKLLLYGLYKQATVGDCNVESEPSRFDVIKHAKYEAWLKFRGMSCEAAMRSYIQVVDEFQTCSPQPPEDYDTQELDMFNAMGVRPSTLAGEEMKHMNNVPSSPLVKAAQDGNVYDLKQVLQELCDKNGDSQTFLNTADESGQTALHFAADRGYTHVVETLLEAGANPNAADLEGISVLQAAVIAGHAKVASLLLQYGANAQQADMDGDTPYSCAHDDGSEEMKRLFHREESTEEATEDSSEEMEA